MSLLIPLTPLAPAQNSFRISRSPARCALSPRPGTFPFKLTRRPKILPLENSNTKSASRPLLTWGALARTSRAHKKTAQLIFKSVCRSAAFSQWLAERFKFSGARAVLPSLITGFSERATVADDADKRGAPCLAIYISIKRSRARREIAAPGRLYKSPRGALFSIADSRWMSLRRYSLSPGKSLNYRGSSH